MKNFICNFEFCFLRQGTFLNHVQGIPYSGHPAQLELLHLKLCRLIVEFQTIRLSVCCQPVANMFCARHSRSLTRWRYNHHASSQRVNNNETHLPLLLRTVDHNCYMWKVPANWFENCANWVGTQPHTYHWLFHITVRASPQFIKQWITPSNEPTDFGSW